MPRFEYGMPRPTGGHVLLVHASDVQVGRFHAPYRDVQDWRIFEVLAIGPTVNQDWFPEPLKVGSLVYCKPPLGHEYPGELHSLTRVSSESKRLVIHVDAEQIMSIIPREELPPEDEPGA